MGVFAWAKRSIENAAQTVGGFQITDLLPQRNFPAVTRDVMAQVRLYADDMGGVLTTTGSRNAYVVATGSGVTELRAGIKLLIRADRANTGEATINVDGLGPLPWVDAGGARLTAGQIAVGRFYEIVLDPDVPAWRVQAGASTLTEIPGLIDLQTDVTLKATAAATSAAATAADRLAVGTDRTATASNAAAAAASQDVAQAARTAAEAARDQLLDTIVAVDSLTDLAIQSAPKFPTVPRAVVVLNGGAIANGPRGVLVPAGQTGAGSLLRVYWDLSSDDIRRTAGRTDIFLGELKTTIGFDKAFVGPGGSADTKLTIRPETPSDFSVELRPTNQADTYAIVLSGKLTGTETQIAANLLIAGGGLPVAADASVFLNQTFWAPIDTAGATDVVRDTAAAAVAPVQALANATAAQVAILPLGVPEMVALATCRTHALAGGAFVGIPGATIDRIVTIPTGQSGAGTVRVFGLPCFGILAGTRARVTFRLQVSDDIGLGPEGKVTALYIFAATFDNNDDKTGGSIAAPWISRIAPGVIELGFERTFTGLERVAEIYLGIAAGPARSAAGTIRLRNAHVDILSTLPPYTVSQQVQRLCEARAQQIVANPDAYRELIIVDKAGNGDYTRVIDASDAMPAGVGVEEMNRIAVLPGRYTDECGVNRAINPADYVHVVGLGRREDVVIEAIFPADQPSQPDIQPLYIKGTVCVENLTVIGENIRYPSHNESANSQRRAVHRFINVALVNRGGVGWPSSSAMGVGQHQGNRLHLSRTRLVSPTGALGVHNAAAWGIPADVLVEDSELISTGVDGQAFAFTASGAGIVSEVCIRNTSLVGYGRLDSTFLDEAPLHAHTARRAEYPVVLDNCSPIDHLYICDVPCLALNSVPGANSSIALSNAGALVLFGAMPDIRRGAADYPAAAYSFGAYGVRPGERDPGVTGAARLGNRSGNPLPLGIAFDGSAVLTLSLDADYRGMSDSQFLSALNSKLAAAMGGDTGGRAFSLATPYMHRGPFRQPSREEERSNVGNSTILKGAPLAFQSNGVRLFASTDPIWAYAGIALDDAIPGRLARYLRSGRLGVQHLRMAAGVAPALAIGDAVGVGATPGVLTKPADRALMRVVGLPSYGAVLEIVEPRAAP